MNRCIVAVNGARVHAAQTTIEIVLTVKNVGPGTGYVDNVQGRVGYSLDGETEVNKDGVEPRFDHLVEPSQPSAGRDEPSAEPGNEVRLLLKHGFLFAPRFGRAFIQPNVTQVYRKPVEISDEARLIHVWAAFEYEIPVGRFGRVLARIFIHYAERRKRIDYSVRRTFVVTGHPTAASMANR